MRVLLLLALLTLGLPPATLPAAEVEAPRPAADPAALPAAAQTVLDRFVSTGAQLQRDADTRSAATKAKLVAALEQLQASEGKAGRLEGALAVKTLHDGLADGTITDLTKAATAADLPKTVARPIEAHQQDQQKIARDLAQKLASLREQTVRDLEAVKVSETKAGHLDTALLIKQQQEQLRTGQAPGRKTPTKALVLGKGAVLTPLDPALLRRGGASSTIEFLILSHSQDGMLFECGALANGQSLAVVGNELWYAIANARREILVKAPLSGARPPLHVAVGFDKGDVQIWVNGALAKRDSVGLDAIGDNGAGGAIGRPGGMGNNPAMPRTGFEGELIAFRYTDRVVYSAPFTPAYPLPASDGVRLGFDAGTLEVGPLTAIDGAQRLTASGEVQVKTIR